MTVEAVLAEPANVSAGTAVQVVTGEVKSLINGAVTVVVDVVANFCGGSGAGVDREVIGAEAVLTMLSSSAGVSTRSAIGRVGLKVEILIDEQVAVVVDIVADFGCRNATVDWRIVAALAVEAALAVSTGMSAHSAVFGIILKIETFVDAAVAVVVGVVADFRGRTATTDGGCESAMSIGAVLVGTAGMATGSTIVLVTGQCKTVVNDTVAIIINVVAGFRYGCATGDGIVVGAFASSAIQASAADVTANAAIGGIA